MPIDRDFYIEPDYGSGDDLGDRAPDASAQVDRRPVDLDARGRKEMLDTFRAFARGAVRKWKTVFPEANFPQTFEAALAMWLDVRREVGNYKPGVLDLSLDEIDYLKSIWTEVGGKIKSAAKKTKKKAAKKKKK